jgi:hypothetical protein
MSKEIFKEIKNMSNLSIDSNRYVVLMETNGEECESWYSCIKYEGNEENLIHLQKQLDSVNWFILDDLSTFDLDMEHFLSEKTAKEITKLELNHYMFHRKFDGILSKIDLGIDSILDNEQKMVRVFNILGYSQIDNYVDKEDIDPEDMADPDDQSSSSDDDYKIETRNPEKNNKSRLPESLSKNRHEEFRRTHRK